MIKRILSQGILAALLVIFASGCIVINVSRSDDKKPGTEEVETETEMSSESH